MKRYLFAIAFMTLLATARTARAQEDRQKYVGSDSCASNLQGQGARFGLRLDKTQRTFLEYRKLGEIKVLLIIQYKVEGDKCGVIRDAVRVRDSSEEFEFSCADRANPGDVVVGTSKRTDSRDTTTTVEAWRIDLKEPTFNRLHRKVICTNESYAGEDDGSDLVDAAKKRATH